MIVADANLIAYLVLPGERSEQAEAVLLKDPVWVVPVLWASELRSVVSHYVGSGDLSLAQGSRAMDRAAALVDGREAPVDSHEVLELAKRSGCSSYDCEYVALAVSLDVVLVTSDKAVLRAFPRVAIAPEVFLNEPTG
jgi:predicted nucleic acid-binding protein